MRSQTSVMSKWCASCVMMLVENEKEAETWWKLYVGGINGMTYLASLDIRRRSMRPGRGMWANHGKSRHTRTSNCVLLRAMSGLE